MGDSYITSAILLFLVSLVERPQVVNWVFTLLNFPIIGKRLEDVISITACTERSGACGCQVVDCQASGRRYLKRLKLSDHLQGGVFQTLTAKMSYNQQRHFVRRNRLLKYITVR